MYDYDYICLRCGQNVYPDKTDSENVILYDLSPLFHGLNKQFPAYFTVRELRDIIKVPPDNAFVQTEISLKELLYTISKRLDDPKIAEITFGDITAFLESLNNDSINETFGSPLQQQSESAFTGYDDNPDSEGQDQNVNIADKTPDKPDAYRKNPAYRNVMPHMGVLTEDIVKDALKSYYNNILFLFRKSDGTEKKYNFTLKINLNQLGNPNTKVGYTYKNDNGIEVECYNSVICGNPSCWRRPGIDNSGAPVPAWAWQYEHIAVGFIGTPNSGKTCLITAILHNIMANAEYDIHWGDKPELIEDCIKDYQNNTMLPKTDAEGSNCFNVTFLYNRTKIITLVDISGECFNIDRNGFDRNRANNYFRMIKICSCYILCLDPDNSMLEEVNFFPKAINDFIEYLLGNDLIKYAAPFMFTITKSDAYIDNEDPFPEIKNRYKPIYTNAKKNVYISTSKCSAYGCKPKPNQHNLKTIDDLLRPETTGAEKYLHLNKNGGFLISNEKKAKGYAYTVTRENPNNTIAFIITDNGIEYIFDVNQYPDSIELKMEEIKFIISETDPNTGVIYNERNYEREPQPRGIQLISDWLFKVCGVEPLNYSVYNSETGSTNTMSYILQKTDKWDRKACKAKNAILACCVKQIFKNPSKEDDLVAENVGKKFSLKLIDLLYSNNFVFVKRIKDLIVKNNDFI